MSVTRVADRPGHPLQQLPPWVRMNAFSIVSGLCGAAGFSSKDRNLIANLSASGRCSIASWSRCLPT